MKSLVTIENKSKTTRVYFQKNGEPWDVGTVRIAHKALFRDCIPRMKLTANILRIDGIILPKWLHSKRRKIDVRRSRIMDTSWKRGKLFHLVLRRCG